MGYGLTNFAIGQAVLDAYTDYGAYRVTSLRSNGLDGVSIRVGEPDSGVFLTPTTGYLEDGNWMLARAYGQLNGTNDTLLATIQGGRASDRVYPLTLDYSPLGPESVTYQIYYYGQLQREFTRGTPMVVVNWGYAVYPTVNPIVRRGSDGALGTSLTMSEAVRFVFPELLSSGFGNELFIRLNNPGHQPGIVSRVDVFGGGNLYDFSFNDIALGVFGRQHRSLYGVSLEAAPNRLRLDNFVNTNSDPGVFITLERAGALNLQFEPFALAHSNAFIKIIPGGSAAGYRYDLLGTFSMNRTHDHLSIGMEQTYLEEMQMVVLSNSVVLSVTNTSTNAVFWVGTNALIRSITTHAKTTQNLPGFHVQFSEPTSLTIGGSGPAIIGDEVRLVFPYPARLEHLDSLYFAGRDIGPLTITNEVVSPPEGPVRLGIARQAENVILTWADPNRLFTLGLSESGELDGSYVFDTNTVQFVEPYASVTVPIVRTNDSMFFRLFRFYAE